MILFGVNISILTMFQTKEILKMGTDYTATQDWRKGFVNIFSFIENKTFVFIYAYGNANWKSSKIPNSDVNI